DLQATTVCPGGLVLQAKARLDRAEQPKGRRIIRLERAGSLDGDQRLPWSAPTDQQPGLEHQRIAIAGIARERPFEEPWGGIIPPELQGDLGGAGRNPGIVGPLL